MFRQHPPAVSRPALRVAVSLAAPWAVAEDLCLDGVEVREVRLYAQWLGRELQWHHVAPGQLAQALEENKVDLAIGGLRATPELRACARLAKFSEKRLGADECPRGTGYRHVWAVRRDRWREWAAVRAYLQVVRHRPARVGVAAAGLAPGRVAAPARPPLELRDGVAAAPMAPDREFA